MAHNTQHLRSRTTLARTIRWLRQLPAWAFLVLLFASCEASGSRELQDGLGRKWKPTANYDTETKILALSCIMADGTEATWVTVVEYDGNGNQLYQTSSSGSDHTVTLGANTTSVVVIMEQGTGGCATHIHLAE